MNEAYESREKNDTNGLATAALILGVVAALGFVFVLPPFVFGATAIVLGFLSAGANGIELRAKIGMCMGLLSMVLVCFILVTAINLLMNNPGLYNDFSDSFHEMYEEIITQEGGFV